MISRMAPREKVLLGVTAGVLVAIITFFLGKFIFERNASLRTQLNKTRQNIEALTKSEADREKWLRREAWLNQKLPVLGDPDVANKSLREAIQDAAKRNIVTLDQLAPGRPRTQPNYTSLALSLEATAPWKDMFEFLRELQGPEKFIAIEKCELKVKPDDKTRLRASLTVAQWFAPK